MGFRRYVSRAVPVKNEHGQTIEWFGTNTDVEDRRQSEEALCRLETALAHIARVTTLGELAASIAHDINQSLAAIVSDGYATLRWLHQSPPNIEEAGRALQDLSVHDSGKGIDANHLDFLVQPFFTTKPAGTGMGLAICRSIVESHAGKIWVASDVNHGATFQFSLPAGSD